jgi:outer membrane protein assembly factor BamB
VGFSDGTLAAFDKNNGFLKWERNFSGAKNRFKDLDSTPVVNGNLLYVTTYSGGLFCLKKSTGDIVWQNEEGASTGVVIANNKLYYASSNGSIIALDPETGKHIWNFKFKEGVGSKPLVHKELVISGNSNGPVVFLSAQSGELIATYTTGWGVSSRVVPDQNTNTLFISSNYGYLYSVQIEWMRRSHLWPWEKI